MQILCVCKQILQIENEYGSYRGIDCGHDYMAHLRDLARFHLGYDIILFTTDGNGESMLECGAIDGVYATVDFGPTLGGNIHHHVSHSNLFSNCCQVSSHSMTICSFVWLIFYVKMLNIYWIFIFLVESDVKSAFAPMRKWNPKGPLVCKLNLEQVFYVLQKYA